MMEVDWTIFGSQTVTVRRGCAVAQSPGHVTCQEGSRVNNRKFWAISESLDNFAYKRCIEGSVGPGSNDNLRIAEAFSHPNKQPVSKISIMARRSNIISFSGAMSAHTTVCLARTDTTASLMTTNTTKTNFTLVAAQFMPTQVRNFWLAKLLANHSNSLPNHSISSLWSYWPPSDSLRGLLVILSSFPFGFQAALLLTTNTSRSNLAWLPRFTEVAQPSSQKPLPVPTWTT